MLQKEKHIRFYLKKILLITLLIFCTTIVQGQSLSCEANIQGKVYDTENKQILLGSTIYIAELNKGVVVDNEGRFIFKNICGGVYTLECKLLGYKNFQLSVVIEGKSVYQDIFLETDEIELASIQIEAKGLQVSTQTENLLTEEDLARTTGKSLGESLKDITGVNVLQTGPSIAKPVIHGLHSSRILILNNGIRQEGQQWGSEHAPEIDPFIATQLSVVKGASSVRYGADAIGGVILVTPAKLPEKAGIGGQLNWVGMWNGRQNIGSAVIEGAFKKWKGFAWRLQGTYKKSGNIETPNYYLSNTGVQELNFSSTVGYKREKFELELFYSRFDTDLGIFKGAHIGNLSDLQAAIQSPVPLVRSDFSYEIENPRQKIIHHLLKATASLKIKTWGKLYFQYGFQINNRKEFDARRGGRSDMPALDLALISSSIEAGLEHRFLKNVKGNVGINASLQDNENIAGTGIRPLIPNYRAISLGVFLIERLVKEKFELEAGIRYDYRFLNAFRLDINNVLLKPEYHFNNISTSLGIIYRFNPVFSFSSNFGTAWRPPAMNELFSEGLHHGVAAIELGNENLKTEQAYKWINTLNLNTKKVSVELSFYHNLIQNYIYLNPTQPPVLTIRGAFPVFQYEQTNATFTGIDFSLKYEFVPHLSFNSKLSLVRVRDVKNNQYLPFIPSDRYENALTYQISTLKKIKNIYVSFNTLNVLKQWRVEEDSDYAPSPAGYMLLNAEAGFGLPIGKNTLSISVSSSNLMNEVYREYMNRFRYYADDIGRNITIRTKFQF